MYICVLQILFDSWFIVYHYISYRSLYLRCPYLCLASSVLLYRFADVFVLLSVVVVTLLVLFESILMFGYFCTVLYLSCRSSHDQDYMSSALNWYCWKSNAYSSYSSQGASYLSSHVTLFAYSLTFAVYDVRYNEWGYFATFVFAKDVCKEVWNADVTEEGGNGTPPRAKPKSHNLTSQLPLTSMLPGFMSRWITPLLWMYTSALIIW